MSKLFKTLFQATGAITACYAVGAQFFLIIQNAAREDLSYAAELVRFLSYMTIWTNVLVALSFLCPLFFARSGLNAFLMKPVVQAGAAVYVLVVGVTYHFLLAGIWDPSGLQYLVDRLLHYVVPVLYLVYWILFAPKGLLKFSDSVLWLVYPLVYIVYALARGALVNAYPYPFIDVSQLGYGVVFRNAGLLALAYLAAGLLLVLADRALSKFSRPVTG